MEVYMHTDLNHLNEIQPYKYNDQKNQASCPTNMISNHENKVHSKWDKKSGIFDKQYLLDLYHHNNHLGKHNYYY